MIWFNPFHASVMPVIPSKIWADQRALTEIFSFKNLPNKGIFWRRRPKALSTTGTFLAKASIPLAAPIFPNLVPKAFFPAPPTAPATPPNIPNPPLAACFARFNALTVPLISSFFF